MRNVEAAPLPQQNSRVVMRLMAASVLVVAAAGAAVSAHAQGHHGPGGGGSDGGAMTMFGGSPRHVDRLLDGLDATEAQRAQIKQIAAAAANDLKPQRETNRSLREKGMQLFTAPSVDPAQAESLRQQMSAQHDQTSRRMLQAMLDVANVLTPEQRAKAGERMKQRQGMMGERPHHMRGERPSQRPQPSMQAAPPASAAPTK